MQTPQYPQQSGSLSILGTPQLHYEKYNSLIGMVMILI
jgi:hypothetical protein